MKRIAITASTGMLGSMLYRELKGRFSLVLLYHSKEKLALVERAYGPTGAHTAIQCDLMDLQSDYVSADSSAPIGPATRALVDAIGEVDAVINAAGVTKVYASQDPHATLFLNGALPHILSSIYGKRLIQITTDCVYRGLFGAPYNERSPKTPNDLYGLSKAIGEPETHSLVLRSSFIGPEIADFTGLLEWLRSKKGQRVSGYSNHWWNGLTTRQLAQTLGEIIDNRDRFPDTGLFHLFSTDITKAQMLQALNEKYNLHVTIEPVAATSAIDRRLTSIHDLCRDLHLPSFSQMLAAM
jgi:dTDP-4-dehydrorhamnose reductase